MNEVSCYYKTTRNQNEVLLYVEKNEVLLSTNNVNKPRKNNEIKLKNVKQRYLINNCIYLAGKRKQGQNTTKQVVRS